MKERTTTTAAIAAMFTRQERDAALLAANKRLFGVRPFRPHTELVGDTASVADLLPVEEYRGAYVFPGARAPYPCAVHFANDWASAAEVADARRALQEYLESMAIGASFDCADYHCDGVTEYMVTRVAHGTWEVVVTYDSQVQEWEESRAEQGIPYQGIVADIIGDIHASIPRIEAWAAERLANWALDMVLGADERGAAA